MPHYSTHTKQTMVSKLMGPGAPSAQSLSIQTGITQATLSKWLREFKSERRITMSETPALHSPRNWSTAEKLNALIQSNGLTERELGEFLRSKGLKSEHLLVWKKQFIDGTVKPPPGRPAKDSHVKKLEKEIVTLKKDLRRKDAALSEASALLILKKKVHEIWGDEEGEVEMQVIAGITQRPYLLTNSVPLKEQL